MKPIIISLAFFLSAPSATSQISEDFETDIITANTLVASSFINDNERWLADNTGVLWHRTNGSESWALAVTGKNFIELDFITSLIGYGITSDAVYKTINGGAEWTVLTMPGSIGNAIYFLNKDTGFISGSGVIYKTTNGGGAWNTTTIEGVCFVDFYFMNAATGIAAANHESGYKSIWRTTNGGESWNNVYEAENYFINAIWFTSETTGWAVGYYDKMGWGHLPAIQKSIDGGLTWQNIYINRYPGPTKGEELLDIRFKNEMEGFAVSTYMESVITSDGGQTWKVTYDD